jgi:hypothetical protein
MASRVESIHLHFNHSRVLGKAPIGRNTGIIKSDMLLRKHHLHVPLPTVSRRTTSQSLVRTCDYVKCHAIALTRQTQAQVGVQALTREAHRFHDKPRFFTTLQCRPIIARVASGPETKSDLRQEDETDFASSYSLAIAFHRCEKAKNIRSHQ